MSEPRPRSRPDVRFEKTDVDASQLLKSGFYIVLATVATVAFLYWMYFVFVGQEAARQPPPPVLKPGRDVLAPPPPLLQTTPVLELAAFRRQEDELLTSYGWVDEERGIVRIPIAEAMRMLAERGTAKAARPAAGGTR